MQYLLQIFSSLPFILDFATTLFVLTTEHTERLHLLLNQQHRLIWVNHLTKMRRYDIVSGILLILSIIDFALPAPVLVQEKRQERVDVVHIPKDVITVLGKRWEEDLEKLGEEYLKTGGKPVESSSSAPLGPDHGSTNIAQLPAPSPASPTANPDPSMKPLSCSSSTSSRQGLWARGNCFGVPWADVKASLVNSWSHKGDYLLIGPLSTPSLTGPSMNHELTWAEAVQRKPNLNSRPSIDPSADPDFDWEYWMNAEDPPPTRPALPKEFGQAHKYQVDPENPPSTSGYAPSPPLTEHEHEVLTNPPSPNLGSPPKVPENELVPGPPSSTDPELHLDHQSSNADSQPVDLQAAIYAGRKRKRRSRAIFLAPPGMIGMRPRGVATC